MTAPATPRTDVKEMKMHCGDMDWQTCVSVEFARTLERELAAMTAERDDYGNRLDRLADSHALTLKCYEQAEAENVALREALEIVAGIRKGPDSFRDNSSFALHVLMKFDAALKEGK